MRAATLVSKLGAVAGEPVAVIAPTCADFFVCLFGIARMGGIVMAMHTRESSAVLASAFQRMGAPWGSDQSFQFSVFRCCSQAAA